MRIPTFDPNEDMAAYGEVSSAEQARIIEEIAWTVNGNNAFVSRNSGVLVLGEPGKDEMLFSCKKVKGEGDNPASPLEAEKQHPDGYWAVMVVANMRDDDDITGLSVYIREAALIGKVPKQVSKIALFASQHCRRWLGGLKRLNEASIYLISDYASAFLVERHDPVGAAQKFVRVSNLTPEKIEISQEVLDRFNDEEIDRFATAFAWRIMSSELRNFMSSSREDIRNWPEAVSKLSLGKLKLSSAIEELHDKRLESYLGKGYIPPKGHPSYKYVLEGERIALIAQMWFIYLQGYGLQPTKHIFDFDTKAFVTPEFEKLIDDVCTQELSDEDRERYVYKAGYLSCKGNDIISANGIGEELKSAERRSWPQKPGGGLNQNRASKGSTEITASSKAIDEAVASIKKSYIEDTGNIFERVMTEYLLNTADGLKFGTGEIASCQTMHLDSDRWKLITSSRMNIDDYAGEGLCAIAAGLIDMDDIDAIVVLRFNFDEIDSDKMASAIKIMEDAEIEHVCDYGGNFDVLQLDDFVIEGTQERFHRYSNLSKRTSLLMRSPGMVCKEILDAMTSQGEKRVILNYIDRINRVVGAHEPRYAEISLSAVCGKDIRMPKKWEENVNEDFVISPLLSVLSPLAKFFPVEGYADIAFSLDAFKLWRKLLDENGLEISDSFPIGVDADLLEHVKEYYGVASYFEALEAGVPLEDLLLEDDGWR